MIIGNYDAEEAIRIYNCQNESLSVLISRRLPALDTTSTTTNSKTNKLLPSKQKRLDDKEKLYENQQGRQRRTRLQKETVCMKDNNITKLPPQSLETVKKTKCLYLGNVEEILLSVLKQDSCSSPINNDYGETAHIKCDKRDKKQRNRQYFPSLPKQEQERLRWKRIPNVTNTTARNTFQQREQFKLYFRGLTSFF